MTKKRMPFELTEDMLRRGFPQRETHTPEGACEAAFQVRRAIAHEAGKELVKWLQNYGGEMYLDDDFTDKRYCITSDMWKLLLKHFGLLEDKDE